MPGLALAALLFSALPSGVCAAPAAARYSPAARRVFAFLREAPPPTRAALAHAFSRKGEDIPALRGVAESERQYADERVYENFVRELEAEFEANPDETLLFLMKRLTTVDMAFRHVGFLDPAAIEEALAEGRKELDAARSERLLEFTKSVAQALWQSSSRRDDEAADAGALDADYREFRRLLFELNAGGRHVEEALTTFVERRPRLAPRLIARAYGDELVGRVVSASIRRGLVRNMAVSARARDAAVRHEAIDHLERWLAIPLEPPVWEAFAAALESLARVSIQGDRLLARLSRTPGGDLEKTVAPETWGRLVVHARFRALFLKTLDSSSDRAARERAVDELRPMTEKDVDFVNQFRRILLELDQFLPAGHPDRERGFNVTLDWLALTGLNARLTVGVVNTLADFLHRRPRLSEGIWRKLAATIEKLGLSAQTLELLAQVPAGHREAALSPRTAAWLAEAPAD